MLPGHARVQRRPTVISLSQLLSRTSRCQAAQPSSAPLGGSWVRIITPIIMVLIVS